MPPGASGYRPLMISRDRFGESVLDILALCSNLENVHVQSEIRDPLRSRLQGERDRWVSQIDERTIWLADHWQHFALGYSRRLACGTSWPGT